MAENFLNLGKKTDIQIQKAQKYQKKMNHKGFTLKHIIIKLSEVNNKGRILKARREKKFVTYKGNFNDC